MSNECDCKTAPATPGLLIIKEEGDGCVGSLGGIKLLGVKINFFFPMKLAVIS